MLLGKVGIAYSDLDLMTLRDIVNAINGYSEMVNDRDEAFKRVIYSAAKFNAYYTAFSTEAQKALKKHRFDFENESIKKTGEYSSYKSMIPFLNKISKN